jgi:hypothetical protein
LTKKEVPDSAAVFAGRWNDSFGDGVHVEVIDDKPTVTLIKRNGTPITLRLYYDSYSQRWRCGNGFMCDLLYKDDPVKGKVLSLVSWATQDGRVSTWIRDHVEEKLATALPDVGSPAKASHPEAPVVSAPQAVPPEGTPKDIARPNASSKSRQSWWDVTEDDDELLSEIRQHGKTLENIPEEPDKPRSSKHRGGRRRSGRGARS